MKYYTGNAGYEEAASRSRCEAEEAAEEEREQKHRHLERRRFPRQDFVALNSATGGAGPLPIITTPLIQPLNIVSVTVDARDLDDISRHEVSGEKVRILLNFTAIINLPIAVVVTLNFQILRSTRETTTPIGPTFTFATVAAVLESESFAFQLFDSDLDPGMYTYTVTLAPSSLIAVTPGVTITNATLSAIATETECS